MTEQNTPPAADTPARQFGIQRIYLKDVSFESPQVPDVFRAQQFNPEVNIQLNNETRALSDGVFEVVLKVTVATSMDEKNVYLVEVQQAGIFTIAGFAEAEMGHLLNSYCPNQLFPYVREVVTDMVAKGGFPQLVLAPVNFDAHYAEHLKRTQQGAAAEQTH